jgi:DNA-directed RNA polymerase subunit beta
MAQPVLSTASSSSLEEKSYARLPKVLDLPNLILIQTASFDWFKTEALHDLFQEISPIVDFTGERFELHFLDHEFQEPKFSELECRQREATYAAPLHVTARLIVKETGEIKEQKLFLGDIPWMTTNGTFIINGAERVVVSQLVRSPGVYLTMENDLVTDKTLCMGKLIPYRGAWMEFETSTKNVISVKVDRKRKAPVTTLLRAIGLVTEEELLAPFANVDTDPARNFIKSTLDRDILPSERQENFKKEDLASVWESVKPGTPYNHDAALQLGSSMLEFYRRLRPGEPPSLDNAHNLLHNLFFNPRRYDLGRVGRYKLDRRLNLNIGLDTRILTREDLIALVSSMIRINNGREPADDIDHLGNRRVRAVGELIQNQLRVGLLRMERVVRERMTINEPEQATPSALVNIRPISAAIREFFGGSQLSQFMDQTNPLAELTHKRRLSALGPGGLSRERAGFDVRDVHHSHYGRICPIETPEGPNIGLLGSLATYARTNEFGFIETPYQKVLHELPNTSEELRGRTLRESVADDSGKIIVKAKATITAPTAKAIQDLSPRTIKLKAFVSPDPDSITYLSADEEENYSIAQANSRLNSKKELVDDRAEIRRGEEFAMESPDLVDYMDVSPMQTVSVSTSLIPFLEHDDANRALMGSNMQRQAVPLLRPEAPIVGTGMEQRVAQDSGQVLLSTSSGIVTSVAGDRIIVTDNNGSEHEYPLLKFLRSNQGTCISQRPIVHKGDIVDIGQPLADSASTDHGKLALGQNALVAFMSWEGYNYEDAVIISERMLQEDKFTSIHIEKYECEARDTKLGPEEITQDIPNVGEEALRDLDEEGIIHIGAEVEPGDILIGKITPKGETELTAEEKLLRAIFGEKARDVKDTSLRVPHGERGKVIDVKILSRDNKDDLAPGILRLVRVWIAQTRKIAEGDKMAGRHGNKGVISRILPVEEMPFLPDGTPVDIILNPIGVPSRMNLGQVLETHLGWAAKILNYQVATPVFDGAQDLLIEDALARAWFVQRSGAEGIYSDKVVNRKGISINSKLKEWLHQYDFSAEELFDEQYVGKATEACLRLWLQEDGFDSSKMNRSEVMEYARTLNRAGKNVPPIFGKSMLYDGRTGEPFAQPVTVGYIYMMKLIHLVEDKIHARSTGPYSLITQQPLGGKAQFGGQRFGEMEVWALEAYSAAHNLQEMLTVKSDDVVGRVKAYESIVKGENIVEPGIPESFHVLLKELQSLGLAVELLSEEEEQLALASSIGEGSSFEWGSPVYVDDDAITEAADQGSTEDSASESTKAKTEPEVPKEKESEPATTESIQAVIEPNPGDESTES